MTPAIHAQPGPSALIGQTAPIFRPLSRGRAVFTRTIQAAGARRASQPVSGAMAVAASGNSAFTGVRVAVVSVEVNGTASAWFMVLINGVLMTDIGGSGVPSPAPVATEQNYVF
jgi:hypothetical protein